MAATTSTAEDRRRAAEVRDRAGEVLQRAGELSERARDRAEDLLHEAEAAVPPAARRARLGTWQAVRALAGVLLVIPRILVRILHAGGAAVETLFARAEDVAEHSQRLASRLPEPRALRRRHRRQLALWTAGGFVAGAGVGYLLARRREVAPHDDPWNEMTVEDLDAHADLPPSMVE